MSRDFTHATGRPDPGNPKPARPALTILMADDDPDDCLLTEEALEELAMGDRLITLPNGHALINYLDAHGPDHDNYPDLVLMDLNMPRMDGLSTLKHLKTDPDHRAVPIVVVSTSNAESDIRATYYLGGNAFINKRHGFDDMVRTLDRLLRFWTETAHLPPRASQCREGM